MQFEWIDFYSEFASKLLLFKNDRKNLIEKINAAYAAIDMKVPKLESGDEIIDIDPFTIFGLFNKGITNANRVAIIGSFANEFEITAKVPDNFDGIPVLNNLKATFYGFKGDRKDDDIDNIWNVFEAALALADNDTEANRAEFIKWYDLVHDQLCIRWNLTMGLYWVRPYCFINLDSRNRWYITNVDNMPADFVEAVKTKINKLPSATDYLYVKDSCMTALSESSYEYKNYPELSYFAWMISEQVNQEKAAATGKKASKAAFLRWFKPLIQALRDLGGSASPADARKKIIENEQLSDEEVNATRGKNNVNKFENEVAFARNYLVSAGYIDKSVYGVWTLTEAGKTVDMTEELASDIFKKGMSENQNKRDNGSSALADDDVDTVHYWIYSPGENSSMWAEFYKAGIMAIGWGEIGDLKAFESKDAMKAKMKEVIDPTLSYKNAAHATWQFANEMKVGDIIFVKKGMYQLVGRGVVTSDYEYDDERADEFANYRRVNWTHNGEWPHPGQAVMKTLTDITSYTEYVEKLNMLSYAFQVLNEQGYKNIATEQFNNTAELMAAILAKGIAVQIKRGLGKEYIPQTEPLSALRGKIDIAESIKTQTMLKKQMICTYDEFSVNGTMNRIIKSTVELLLRSDISKARKKELRKLMVYFGDVEPIDLYTVNWNIQYNRNNQTYRLLISICYLVVKGLLQTNSDGSTRLMDFMDEQRMCRLYEKFILEYYRKEYPEITANASQIPWQLDDGISAMLPVMQTDIMLTYKEKVLIIDAKYYTHTMQSQFNTHTLHSGNLYQIFTYVKNKETELSELPHEVSGMLLYAKTDEAVLPDNSYKMSGNKISVKTLDLDCDFSEIAKQLNAIVEAHFDIERG